MPNLHQPSHQVQVTTGCISRLYGSISMTYPLRLPVFTPVCILLTVSGTPAHQLSLDDRNNLHLYLLTGINQYLISLFKQYPLD